MSTLKVLTWSPSRFAKYKECPRKVLYEDLNKLCPKCFKGRLSGGFDGEPVVCDSCDKPQPEREALDRGNAIDTVLSGLVSKKLALPKVALYDVSKPEKDQYPAVALRHPAVVKLVASLRKLKGVTQQESIVLDQNWNRVNQRTKNAWARLKLDVLHVAGKLAKVIDWKSGNIDKSKGEIREREEYYDSMRAYQLSVMAAYQQVQTVAAMMVFTDAPPKLADPSKSLPVLNRKDFPEARRNWEKKITPMMHDTIFAPKPGMYCNWCGFSKDRGGPCPFGGSGRGM
jgi:uncharacterized protein (DUF983 family)